MPDLQSVLLSSFLAEARLLQTNPNAVYCTMGNLLPVCAGGKTKQMPAMLTPEGKRQ